MQNYSSNISKYKKIFFILNCQNSANTYNNLKNGDIYFDNKYYLDLKVGSKDNQYTGAINKTSIDGFRSDGYYLCIDYNFTKFYIFSHAEIVDALNNNKIKYRNYGDGNFLGEHDYNKIFKPIII